MSNSLMHYASKYYDPVKASEYNHEYYMEHRKLVGRKTASNTDDINSQLKANYEKLKQQIANLKNTPTESKTVEKAKITQQINNAKAQVQSAKTKASSKSEEKDYESEWYDPNINTSSSSSTSTSGLNAEGRAIAKQVKENINKKRDEDIALEKETMNENISEVRSQIEELKTKSAEERAKYKEEITAKIQELKEEAAERKQELQEQLGIRIEETSEKIKSRTEQAKSDVELIRSAIKSLGKGDTVRKEALLAKIDEIQGKKNSENSEDRESIKEDRKSTSAEKKEISEELKTNVSSLRTDLKNFNASNIEERNRNVKELRSAIDDFRSETKAKIASIKEEAKNTYIGELEKIKSISKYQSKKKK